MTKLNHSKSILATLFCCLLTSHSYAVETAGKTMITKGTVNAISNEQEEIRPLKRRSAVFVNDVVTTGPSSKTQLRMTDGSMIAMKENSQLIIAEYKFGIDNDKDSVVLDLVQGGLRSITGAIKADQGDYKLKTPIGSIGIRGTHYEVQIVNDTVWFAVWDGAIDVELAIGINAGSTLSLGFGENYSYASVGQNGTVTHFIEPPKIFKQGLSSKTQESNELSYDENTSYIASIEEKKSLNIETETIITSLEKDNTEFIVYDQFNVLEPQNIADLVAARKGVLEYSDAAFTSSYNLSNFSAGMAIDFDSGEISNGHLSFNDDRSTDLWNAVFNGNMYIRNDNVFMEVGITFASHGNNIAYGNISTSFINFMGLDAVSGGFELFDRTTGIAVDGAYLIRKR
ncbi:FecR domain-containing protein [Colwellia sp. BRX10-3]|uniref:FecR family protein n=1 Tax=Colwellia sp. BRX10-3 TaxID=2759844 RepID=UPI0015F61D1E|nr:FecR family protein [Colwellia sp. BRX10-3]MBA6391507.1 FecR domain-containing protein [Colwellia sp. BRX10-3]